MAEPMAQSPDFHFTLDPQVASFNVPSEAYAAANPAQGKYFYSFVATGAVVFDRSSPPRILLIQRAANDSMPNRWETPGGAVDPEDPSILHGAARELWEEAGLKAARIGPLVGDGYVFLTSKGRLVCKFNFIIDAEREEGQLNVKLDPKEHQAFVWATEEEVKQKKVGDLELQFTTKDQEALIWKAFDLKSGMDANSQKI